MSRALLNMIKTENQLSCATKKDVQTNAWQMVNDKSSITRGAAWKHVHCKSACLLRLNALDPTSASMFLEQNAAAVMKSDTCKNRSDIAWELVNIDWTVSWRHIVADTAKNSQNHVGERARTRKFSSSSRACSTTSPRERPPEEERPEEGGREAPKGERETTRRRVTTHGVRGEGGKRHPFWFVLLSLVALVLSIPSGCSPFLCCRASCTIPWWGADASVWVLTHEAEFFEVGLIMSDAQLHRQIPHLRDH